MRLPESFHRFQIPEHSSPNKNGESCAISFLISTYNRAPYVEACVRNLLSAETSHSIEVIVRDNGSGDDTKSVIEAINDTRLRYVRAPRNQGTISFLEVGRLARGEVITWLSDEDNFEYQHLDHIINTFKDDPTCSVLIGSVTVGPHSTEVIFPERVITNTAEALAFTLQFSGCGGLFIRGDLFRLNCNIHLADQYEAYKTWNYYPIGFFATTCFEQKLITTSRILVRQTRQAGTTNNWTDVENKTVALDILYPHYYPKSISDRLYSNLIIVFKKKNLDLRAKIKLSALLTESFINQINSILHPDLIKLLADNYPESVVEAYRNHIQKKHLDALLIRKAWIVYKLLSVLLRLVAWRVRVGYTQLTASSN